MNEQQPTPNTIQQSTPESEQSVAAVRDVVMNEPPAQTEPKPAPPLPPEPELQSRLAVAPIPPERQRRMMRRMSRTSPLWMVCVFAAVVFLLLAALDLCTTPQEIAWVVGNTAIVLAVCAAWVAFMSFIRRRRPSPPPLWSETRINELYPQGAVSRGANGTVVLLYKNVTLYEETAEQITLIGRGGMIAWSSADLTPPAANALQLYLRARVPAGSIQIKGAFQPRAFALAPIPTLPPRGDCVATATAENRPLRLTGLRFLDSWERALPLMWLFAISADNLISRLFEFSEELLAGPWIWFFGLVLAQWIALFVILLIEAAGQARERKPAPEFLFYEDAMWVVSDAGEIRFPRGTIPVSVGRNALELRLPSGLVHLPYRAMTDKKRIFQFFDNTQQNV